MLPLIGEACRSGAMPGDTARESVTNNAASEFTRTLLGQFLNDFELKHRNGLFRPGPGLRRQLRSALQRERDQAARLTLIRPTVRYRGVAAQCGEAAPPANQYRDVLLAVYRVGDRRRRDAEPGIKDPEYLSARGIVGHELAVDASLENEVPGCCHRAGIAHPRQQAGRGLLPGSLHPTQQVSHRHRSLAVQHPGATYLTRRQRTKRSLATLSVFGVQSARPLSGHSRRGRLVIKSSFIRERHTLAGSSVIVSAQVGEGRSCIANILAHE